MQLEFLLGKDKSQLTKKQIKGLERKNNLETKLTNLLDRKIDRSLHLRVLVSILRVYLISTYLIVKSLVIRKVARNLSLLNGALSQKRHQD